VVIGKQRMRAPKRGSIRQPNAVARSVEAFPNEAVPFPEGTARP
jgi:hypothetical protein